MRRLTPKKRIMAGISFIMMCIPIAAMSIVLFIIADTDSFVFFFPAIVGFYMLVNGIYIFATIKSYKKRYFPDHRLATPIMPDGQLNKQRKNQKIMLNLIEN